MIAISVLRGVRKTLIEQRGQCRRVRCFFSEVDAKAISQLRAAVAPYHDPQSGFEICTFHGEFADAVSEIQSCVDGSFADASLPRGAAVEKLFRETLKRAGQFEFVIATRIDKATAERPHFFLVYGTKSVNGLKTFRETEYAALRVHARNRANAKERKRQEVRKTPDFFAGHAEAQEASIDDIVEQQKQVASFALVEALANGKSTRFDRAMCPLLERFMIRETDVKDVCVALADRGTIENTWGGGKRKPRDGTTLRLVR